MQISHMWRWTPTTYRAVPAVIILPDSNPMRRGNEVTYKEEFETWNRSKTDHRLPPLAPSFRLLRKPHGLPLVSLYLFQTIAFKKRLKY